MALVIPPDVLRQLAAVPRRDRERLLPALELVAAEPMRRLPFVPEMVGEPGIWRLQKEDWRAVYRWREGDVVVDRIGNRRDVYR